MPSPNAEQNFPTARGFTADEEPARGHNARSTAQIPMLELSPPQIAVLQRLAASGFQITRFPLYESAVVVVRGNCAALLGADANSGLRLLAPPSYLIENNLAVRITRSGKNWFVWKKRELEATSARLQELEQFTSTITRILGESVAR